MTKKRLSTAEENYLIKEYDKLNTEISNLLKEIHLRERYSLTILGLVAAWIFNESITNNVDLLKYNSRCILIILGIVLFVIILLFGISVLSLYRNIRWMGDYLRNIEDYFLEKERKEFEFGWEKHFKKINKNNLFIGLATFFWIFCLAMDLLIIMLLYNR
jgi:hypothetical protein